jgi:hypothetical protein
MLTLYHGTTFSPNLICLTFLCVFILSALPNKYPLRDVKFQTLFSENTAEEEDLMLLANLACNFKCLLYTGSMFSTLSFFFLLCLAKSFQTRQ